VFTHMQFRPVAVVTGLALIGASLSMTSPAFAATGGSTEGGGAVDDSFTYFLLEDAYTSGTIVDDSAYKASQALSACVGDNDKFGIPASDWTATYPAVTAVRLPSSGQLSATATKGCFLYTPQGVGSDSFDYMVTGEDGVAHLATASITTSPLRNVSTAARDYGLQLSNPMPFPITLHVYDKGAPRVTPVNVFMPAQGRVDFVIPKDQRQFVSADGALEYEIIKIDLPAGSATASAFPVYTAKYSALSALTSGKTVTVKLNNKASKLKKQFRVVSTSAKTGKIEKTKVKTVKAKKVVSVTVTKRKIGTKVLVQVKVGKKWVTKSTKSVK